MTRRVAFTAAAAAAMTIAGALAAAANPQSAGRVVTLRHCIVVLSDDVDVSAEESGKLVELTVKEGAVVEEGALLARVDDTRARLGKFVAERELNAARARASDDVDVRFAEASLDVADAELQQALDIRRRAAGSVPDSDIRRLELTKRRAELQIGSSQLDLTVASMTAEVREADLRAAEQEIERRRITSPLSGEVFGIIRQRGEWVNAGEPILRIVRMDTLYVEGFVDARAHGPAEVADRPVVVEVELERGRVARFEGRVTFISPLYQAGEKYRVRAEVANDRPLGHWQLRPGMVVQMHIDLEAEPPRAPTRRL